MTFQTESKAGFSQYTAIEHYEIKIITHFENEVGPGMLWSSNEQTYNLQNFAQHGQNRHIISCTWCVPLVFLQHSCLSSAGLGHSGFNIVFKHPRLKNYSIFGILYCIKPIEGEKGESITEQSTQKNLQLQRQKLKFTQKDILILKYCIDNVHFIKS